MAQAKLIESLDKFLDVLDKSNLFPSQQIQKFRQDLNGSDKQPLDIARMLVKNRKLSKWQASQLLSGYYKFRQGQFVLRDQLGKSRLGGLLLAFDEKRNQLVALRSLSKAAIADPQAVQQFLDQAQAATAFQHQNVAGVLEINSEGDRHLIVTEYVKGRDFQTRVDEDGPLDATAAQKYLEQAAAALGAAHAQQLVHGSLHPACLLADAEDQLKIADWCLAPLRDARPGYDPPERAAGQATPSQDIYALGGTLYFLLSGQTPQAGVPLAKLQDGLPAPLVDLCSDMLSDDPSQRPASMQDVLTRISQLDNPDATAELEPVLEEADDEVVELDVLEELDELEEVTEPPAGNQPASEESASKPTASKAPQPAAAKPPAAKPPAKPAKQAPPAEAPAADTVEPVVVEAANKTAPISDTAAIAISTGKETAAPVGAFKISTKKKKGKKSKGAGKAKPAAATAEADTEEFVTSAKPSVAAAANTTPQKPARPKRQPATADPEPADASAEDAATPKKKKKKKSGVPLALIIGAVAVCGLGLLGGGGLLAFLLLRGGDEVVAQADTTGAAAEAEIDPEADEPEIDPEDIPDEIQLVSDDGTPDATDGGEGATGDDPPGGEADPAGEDFPGAGTPEASPPADGGAGTAAPGGAGADPGTTTPSTADPATPTATPTTDPPAAPTTETEQPAEDPEAAKKRADEEAAEKKRQADDAAAKKKANDKKKADEKKKAAGPVFVFQPAVELPPIPEAGATSPPLNLGKINIEPTDVCFISMSGGEDAARGRAEFGIRNAKSGTAPRDWELYVTDNGEETVLATLALPVKDLQFQWLPAAAENQFAGNIRNCKLKITAGSAKPQELALRKPIVGESVAIDLTKPSLQGRWNVDSPPDPGTLQIHTSVKGNKIVLDPPQPVNAMKGTQWIYLGDNKDTSVLALKLDSTVTARGIQVTLKPYLTIPGEKPMSYNKATKKKVTQQLAQRGQMQAKITFLQDQLKKAPAQRKQQVQIALTQSEQELQAFDKLAQMVSQLDQIEQSYSNSVLDFEVMYRTLQGETVLVKTQAGGGNASP